MAAPTEASFAHVPAPNAPSVILVAHGQPSTPEQGEAALAEVARGVARHLPDRQVSSATLAGAQTLEAALRDAGDSALIYPMFMTQGWFLTNALSKRLEGHSAQVLPPFGAEPGLPALAARILSRALQKRHWQAARTCLVLASHGSGGGRPGPSRDTEAFAQTLESRLHFADLRIGYIEEEPFLAEAARGAPECSLCLPFFAAQGGHVEMDIPEALEKAGFAGVLLPPLGVDPDVPGMIARAVMAFEPVTPPT